MTQEELIGKIKAEIERLRGIGGLVPLDNREQKTGYESAMIDVETFLDTLDSEKPMQEGLEEEIKKEMANLPFFIRGKDQIAFARHFAEWGAEHAREQMKEAVEGKIIFLLNGDVAVNIGDTDKYNLGQKVRVIVLPK